MYHGPPSEAAWPGRASASHRPGGRNLAPPVSIGCNRPASACPASGGGRHEDKGRWREAGSAAFHSEGIHRYTGYNWAAKTRAVFRLKILIILAAEDLPLLNPNTIAMASPSNKCRRPKLAQERVRCFKVQEPARASPTTWDSLNRHLRLTTSLWGPHQSSRGTSGMLLPTSLSRARGGSHPSLSCRTQ